ncbi:MAG: lecithin retinol acyltransferase family protein [Kiritimatiellae bacterium]|nr:lecithin retinol acyltransferase family protein [Kiritimatiellia bacterium]
MAERTGKAISRIAALARGRKLAGFSIFAAGMLAIAKSGVFQSAAARLRRKRDGGRLVEGCDVVPGTPLLVSLARGIAEHSGVYLGESRVAELSGDGCVRVVPLTVFLNGDAGAGNLRMGTRIFAACDRDGARPLGQVRVAEEAMRFAEEIGSMKYSLFGNNCHMFTASCVCGRLMERMGVRDWVKRGTFSIDRLEETVSQRLNGGRSVAWLGVRAPCDGFRYVLADGKAERLAKERLGRS